MSRPLNRSLMTMVTCCVMAASSAEAGNRLYDMSLFLAADWTGSAATVSPALAAAERSSPPVATWAYQTADRGASRDDGSKPLGGILSEVRLGVLKHDFGPFSSSEEDGIDVNLELLFAAPGFLEIIWSPRPHVGATINTDDDTNQVYFGLSWEFDLWRDLFAGFSLGGSVHDGETETFRTDKKELGCHLLFRESVEIGYRFAGHHAITMFLDHVSNANICVQNEGLENFGVRYGYRF